MEEHYKLSINGEVHETDAGSTQSLLDVLREKLRLTGTKKGCDEAECGSCTVIVDGKPMLSCILLMGDAQGKEILTIEGISNGGVPHPLQLEMVKGGGIQCGYCTPGIIMSAYALLVENPDPSEEEIRYAISGNICRCTGYIQIFESLLAAAKVSASE
jgi:aerobic-type carbon monoxide dehydrogenase small subunit (CoxS/CutS family)